MENVRGGRLHSLGSLQTRMGAGSEELHYMDPPQAKCHLIAIHHSVARRGFATYIGFNPFPYLL